LPRSGHGIAYDSARAVTVLFGGYGPPTGFGDTWEWDGRTWAQVATTGPSPRDNLAISYDSRRGVTVLFGGFGRSPSVGVLSDTWEWDGTIWTRRATTGPPPRQANGLTYDARRGVTVLFGGMSASAPLGDTWEWDGTTWTLVAPTGPSARGFPGMAYDSARGVSVLFGGAVNVNAFGDTWEWDGGTWTQVAVTGPSPRRPHSMVYDSARGVSVLFGGWAAGIFLGDTWEWDSSTWAGVATTGPSPRTTQLAYDSVRGVTVLAGGFSNLGNAPDTWELRPDDNRCNGTQRCDPATGACIEGPPVSCDDGNACNGVETCDPTLGCVPGTPLLCAEEDQNACTAPTCDPAGGCGEVAVADGTSCTAPLGCATRECESGQCEEAFICQPVQIVEVQVVPRKASEQKVEVGCLGSGKDLCQAQAFYELPAKATLSAALATPAAAKTNRCQKKVGKAEKKARKQVEDGKKIRAEIAMTKNVKGRIGTNETQRILGLKLNPIGRCLLQNAQSDGLVVRVDTSIRRAGGGDTALLNHLVRLVQGG